MTRRSAILAFVAVTLVFGLQAAVTPADAFHVNDSDSAPMVWSASLRLPQRHNEILETDLDITAWASDSVVAYEYRWIRATVGAVHTTDAVVPVVSFAPTVPEQRHVLEVRAVGANGLRSRWFVAADLVTPPAPRVIVAGDSIASGYSRQWFTSRGVCRDAAFAYGATLASDLAERLPAAWAPSYHNVAWAGAGVHSMWSGGSDSCGDEHQSQVEEIVALADPATWNTVVITAGINSTNWSEVVANLTKDTAFSLFERGDQRACRKAVTERWDLPSRTASIGSATSLITGTLAARTNADLYWTSYYTIIDSRLAPGWTPIGAECDHEMADAMKLLDDALGAGLGDSVTWIDIERDSVAIQDWGGWPHPDRSGHVAIGRRVAAAIG
ncbi:MAG: hypothetical protein R2823_01945 [Acidimicrobiia bacterium]